ncbi:MAG: bifunctional DNA primase/polymerase, partial [Chloroflexi bacterium]|nr:bifunctional DNA primase/polymerase [Chloroflexota bacterium]
MRSNGSWNAALWTAEHAATSRQSTFSLIDTKTALVIVVTLVPNLLVDAAIAYARQGYSVIPLKPGSKVPLLVSWKEYQRKALTEADLRGFWREEPAANVGIVTGKVSNLAVVDLDGPTAVAALKAENVALPVTRTFKTPHGWHYVYRYTESLHQGAGFVEGVDVRSEGGYIVAPPSIVWPCTKTGCTTPEADHPRDYKILRDIPTVDYVEVPALFERVKAQTNGVKPDPGSQPEWVATALLNGAPEGQRNDLASRLAGYFRSINVPQDIALAALKQFADACNPPMHLQELRAVVTSVWRYTPSRITTYQGKGTTKPIVDETISTRRIFQWPEEGLTIRAERIRETSDGITCWLTVATSGVGEIYGPVTFNLLADRSRTSLARTLRERQEANWLGILDQMAKHIVASFTSQGLSEDAAQIVPAGSAAWLAHPILKTGQPTLLYADGGVGKSSWSQALAASIVLGQSLIPGIRVSEPASCMYLDWEGSRDEFGVLRCAIERAYGVTLPPDRLRYRRMRQSLPDELDSVQREVAEWDIKAVVVDSIVGAAGEDVEKSEGARLHFACLSQLGVASLNLT